jgi:hypothetical protein
MGWEATGVAEGRDISVDDHGRSSLANSPHGSQELWAIPVGLRIADLSTIATAAAALLI